MDVNAYPVFTPPFDGSQYVFGWDGAGTLNFKVSDIAALSAGAPAGTLVAGVYAEALVAEVNSLESSVSALEGTSADAAAAADSATAAAASETAAASVLQTAILDVAQTFPSSFINGSTFFTNQTGETESPTSALAQTLPGTFVTVSGMGQVYQTEASPTGANSFGAVGLIKGVPGKIISIQVMTRALSNNTAGGDSYVGASFVGLDEAYGTPVYLSSTVAYDNLNTSAGWQVSTYEYTIPMTGYKAWYRPHVYYNYAASGPAGNQQFQFASLLVVDGVSALASLAPPQVTDYTSGSATYTVPTGALYLKVKMKAGGGGGAGSGVAATGGANGADSTFGSFTAHHGAGSAAGATHGSGGSSGPVPSGVVSTSGQDGAQPASSSGFTYTQGGDGGGPRG